MTNTTGNVRAAKTRPVHTKQLRIALTYDVVNRDDDMPTLYDPYDAVRMVAESLRSLGHDVFMLDVRVPVAELVEQLSLLRPHLIYNTVEGTEGRARDAFYPLLFEQLGIPFTGADSRLCTITRDKYLTRQLVASRGVTIVSSILIFVPEDVLDHQLKFPLRLMPNVGAHLEARSSAYEVVETQHELEKMVNELLLRCPEGVLVEERIDGLDIVVPLFEGCSSHADGILEPVHCMRDFGTHTRRRRHAEEHCVLLRDMTEPIFVSQRVHAMQVSRVVVDALQLRDIARIDYRLDKNGVLFFRGVSAFPQLAAGGPLRSAAAFAGHSDLEDVVESIVESAHERFRGRNASRRWGMSESELTSHSAGH